MVNIDSNAFFSSCLQIVDGVIGSFVEKVFTAIVHGHSTEITLCFTLYIVLIGYRFVTHQISSDILTITKQLILMLIVYGLIINYDIYNKLIYNVFTQEPESLAQSIVGGDAVSVQGALDKFFHTGIKVAGVLLGSVKITNITPLFYAGAVWFATTMLSILALLLLIYAKMGMAIGLGIAPIFLICLLWDSTKGLFNAWLNKLINFALVPIVTSAVLSLMMSVTSNTLPDPNLPFEQQDLFGIAAFITLSLATVGLLSRVFHICSALAGSGVSLGGITEGVGSMRRRQGQSNNKEQSNSNSNTSQGGGQQKEGGGKSNGGGDKKESIRNNRADKK